MQYELQSEELNEFATAMCKTQGEISAARKDSNNPFFKSNYADLGSVTEAIREAAVENGLAYTQTNIPADNGVTVVTTVIHTSGQWVRGFLFLPATKVDPQQFGSAMTYARRYSLAAAFGVVQEDDDGNGATHGDKKPEQKQPPKNNAATAEIARELKDELLAISMGSVEEATDRLKEFTTFQGKEGEDVWMKWEQVEQCSENWLKSTLSKVKKSGVKT